MSLLFYKASDLRIIIHLPFVFDSQLKIPSPTRNSGIVFGWDVASLVFHIVV